MPAVPVTVQLDPRWIDRQLAVRRWTSRDFQAHARISRPTAAKARAGRPIDQGSLDRIAAAFVAYPPDERFDVVAEGLK
jgi:hypothetical protein